ncbi:hypothetical protein [Microbulbifer sp. THAF38]|uniref:hypothetical protein n=1 Tax=Microbulbifer sp. THAF38 TaxID=2587856 RepID=UPI00126886CE|nr:hypothetical protein [Microbulbifer sp. THAF38]QFT54881.1 hypothetical protein FIU95_09970 [Microbulbifer sp. THAF38]
MHELYRAPDSALGNGSLIYKPSVLWKVLFFLLVPIELTSQYEAFAYNEYNQPIWWLIASLIIYTTYFVGFFGLAFAKKIGNARFWAFFLPVIIATDIYKLGTVIITMNMAVLKNQMAVLMITPLALFLWFIIFRYRKVFRYIK